MGTHDDLNANSLAQTGPFFENFVLPSAGESGGVPSGTESFYSVDYGNVHIVVLNTIGVDVTSNGTMLSWLTQDLAATSAEWIIAVIHHSPYSKGSHDSDTDPVMVAVRENILPVLEAGGLDLAIGGYSHDYERSFLVDGAYATPTIADGQCLIRLQELSICGSDCRHGYGPIYSNDEYPLAPGRPCHECAGTVVESRTDKFHEGQRVIVLPGAGTGGCGNVPTGAKAAS